MKCPKCGCEEIYFYADDHDWFVAECEKCGYGEGRNPWDVTEYMFPDWFKK